VVTLQKELHQTTRHFIEGKTRGEGGKLQFAGGKKRKIQGDLSQKLDRRFGENLRGSGTGFSHKKLKKKKKWKVLHEPFQKKENREGN